jgi:hypothetical protein
VLLQSQDLRGEMSAGIHRIRRNLSGESFIRVEVRCCGDLAPYMLGVAQRELLCLLRAVSHGAHGNAALNRENYALMPRGFTWEVL